DAPEPAVRVRDLPAPLYVLYVTRDVVTDIAFGWPLVAGTPRNRDQDAPTERVVGEILEAEGSSHELDLVDAVVFVHAYNSSHFARFSSMMRRTSSVMRRFSM